MKLDISTTAAAVLLSLPSTILANDLYLKSSAVLRLNALTYDKHITYTNHTSIVEFYAPWCGHCQRLKGPYEKAAKNLKGLAKVAGVNCDEEKNKAFCSTMGVKGFPTLKIVRPSKKGGYPIVEDYQGERNAKSIVNAVIEKITNHVKRVTTNSMDSWLNEKNETAKAILFTEKGTVSAMWRALAIDFLSVVNFGQVRSKEKELMETFGVTKVPAVVLLPGGEKEARIYDGELTKEALIEFVKDMSGVEPNPDPPKGKPKKDKKPDSKKSKKAKKEPLADEKKPVEKKKATPKRETPDSAPVPPPVDTKPKDQQQPIVATEDTDPTKKPAPKAVTEEALRLKCLSPTSSICALVVLPPSDTPATDLDAIPETTMTTLEVLARVYKKHYSRDTMASFQFHVLDNSLQLSQDLRVKLGLKPKALELVAVNAKRGWYKRYGKRSFGYDEVDEWVDGVKMGQGQKEDLPDVLVLDDEEIGKLEQKIKEDAEKEVEEAKEQIEKVLQEEKVRDATEEEAKERDEL